MTAKNCNGRKITDCFHCSYRKLKFDKEDLFLEEYCAKLHLYLTPETDDVIYFGCPLEDWKGE